MKRSQAITAFVVGLAQLLGRGDRERAHEVLHVEPVSAPRARALLLLQPDFFFGDRGELVQRRERGAVAAGSRHRQGAVVVHSMTSSACANSAGGTMRPSAVAVLRLMTNSNFVGCSTGKPAGLVPRNKLRSCRLCTSL